MQCTGKRLVARSQAQPDCAVTRKEQDNKKSRSLVSKNRMGPISTMCLLLAPSRQSVRLRQLGRPEAAPQIQTQVWLESNLLRTSCFAHAPFITCGSMSSDEVQPQSVSCTTVGHSHSKLVPSHCLAFSRLAEYTQVHMKKRHSYRNVSGRALTTVSLVCTENDRRLGQDPQPKLDSQL